MIHYHVGTDSVLIPSLSLSRKLLAYVNYMKLSTDERWTLPREYCKRATMNHIQKQDSSIKRSLYLETLFYNLAKFDRNCWVDFEKNIVILRFPNIGYWKNEKEHLETGSHYISTKSVYLSGLLWLNIWHGH